MQQDGFSRYHPSVNFIFFVIAIGFAVVIQHPWYLAVSLAAGGCYYGILTGRRGLLQIGMLLPAAAFIAAVNPLFNTYGNHVLFSLWGRPYTAEALLYGAVLGGIFADMMLWFGCYNAVLTSDKFTSLFGRLIPSLSLLLVMVLRLIPGFIRKARQIAQARKSIGKGAGENSTFRGKLHDGVSILSVMTDWVLEGGIVTADSMRARGYGTGKRTSFRKYRFTLRDGLLLAVLTVLTVLVLTGGSVEASFTPEIRIAPLSYGIFAYGILLMIPALIEWKERLEWRILRSGI